MNATSLALLEIANLTPALLVADRCCKTAGVEILGIESTMGAEQCLKLSGGVADVVEAGRQGMALVEQMGSRASFTVITGPTERARRVATLPPITSRSG